MYEIGEISLADTRRLFRYLQEGVFGAEFNLKGFDYPWILTSKTWRRGEKVLDVGGGYSDLPAHIAREYGCEVWVADDFGRDVGDEFWKRNREPLEHILQHPEVKFVLERIGDPRGSSLPPGHFDTVMSASTLEHIPPAAMERVWRHMDLLLRPGGEMLHALDIALPTSRGLLHVLLALGFDVVYPVVPAQMRLRFMYETPKAYVRSVLRALPVRRRGDLGRLDVTNLVLNPEIMLEPPQHTYNRITRDAMANMRHFRVTSLLIHLRKGGRQ